MPRSAQSKYLVAEVQARHRKKAGAAFNLQERRAMFKLPGTLRRLQFKRFHAGAIQFQRRLISRRESNEVVP
jgi:hypothetical protein